jgi:hypothetical protein
VRSKRTYFAYTERLFSHSLLLSEISQEPDFSLVPWISPRNRQSSFFSLLLTGADPVIDQNEFAIHIDSKQSLRKEPTEKKEQNLVNHLVYQVLFSYYRLGRYKR